MKRNKLGVFAIVVFVVVGYAVYDYWSTQNQEKKASEQKVLFSAPSDQVQKVTLIVNGKEIQVERSGAGWKMTKPVQDEANANMIEQYIDGIATEKIQDTVAEGDHIDYRAFGLDQPKGVIELGLNSGKTVRFAIGGMKNYQGDAYLVRDQEPKVHIVSSTWISKIDKSPLDFRDKRLMRRSNAGTEKIKFESPGEKFQLNKKDGQWVAEGHPDWKLDQNKVRELLAQLNSTEALEFIAEGDASPAELKKWGLQPPAFRLIVEAAPDAKLKPWVADFAPGSDKIYRVRVSEPNQVMKIAPSELGKFQVLSLDSFRDRTEPFNFDQQKVHKVEMKLGEKTYNFKNGDEKIKDLIGQFAKIKVATFSSEKSAKLDHEISLQDESGKEVYKFQWGHLHPVSDAKGTQNVYAARSSSYSEGFTVSESDINLLNLNEMTKQESVK